MAELGAYRTSDRAAKTMRSQGRFRGEVVSASWCIIGHVESMGRFWKDVHGVSWSPWAGLLEDMASNSHIKMSQDTASVSSLERAFSHAIRS